ncbi:NO-inducible flavohemoprotein [Olivibacter jilunii]|uniref:NO-inducible flavohemoprotein n=1 Tax=Olivibacter jilunii TaxID=985016 RepID=UPI003F15AD49
MNEQQKALVKGTVPVLKENGVLLTTHFYERMFKHNPELKHVFNMGNQQNKKQQMALVMAVLAYAEHIDNPGILMPVVDSIGQKHTSLDIRPEQYAIVGGHLIASISEVLGDAASEDLLKAWEQAYHELAQLMSGHEQKLYKEKSTKSGGWVGWRPFRVEKKIKESAEITSFYLYPTDNGPVADFLPGQYVSLRLFLPELGLLQPRQYSISCKPNGIYYRISVKKEIGAKQPDGMISNRLHQHIEEGAIIDLSAPSGNFILKQGETSPQVFISGGIGQTPLLSMLEHLVDRKSPVPITWIHGCRNEQVHAFKQHLHHISSQHGKLQQHIFYDVVSDSKTGDILPGWVSLNKIPEEFLYRQAQYYICGPGPFIKTHYNYLLSIGISKDSIHFEEFGPASISAA